MITIKQIILNIATLKNVLITRYFTVKVGDFGVSKKLDPNESHAPYASSFVGTKAYLAPECFKGSGYSTASDVWSLGCVLYEMITLQRAVS